MRDNLQFPAVFTRGFSRSTVHPPNSRILGDHHSSEETFIAVCEKVFCRCASEPCVFSFGKQYSPARLQLLSNNKNLRLLGATCRRTGQSRRPAKKAYLHGRN